LKLCLGRLSPLKPPRGVLTGSMVQHSRMAHISFSVFTGGGQSHFFRLRSYSQIFESGSGFGYSSNLRKRLLFRLATIIDPTVIHPCFYLRNDRLLLKWKSDCVSGFSQNFDSGSERKMQNSTGVDPGSGPTFGLCCSLRRIVLLG